MKRGVLSSLPGTTEVPVCRVFPNKLPKEDRAAAIDVIIGGLKEAGNYADGTSVTVLMETHGDVVESAVIKKIMDAGRSSESGTCLGM